MRVYEWVGGWRNVQGSQGMEKLRLGKPGVGAWERSLLDGIQAQSFVEGATNSEICLLTEERPAWFVQFGDFRH